MAKASTDNAPVPAPPVPVKCAKCDGATVLDSKDNLPWTRPEIAGNPEVRAGNIFPVYCPDCKGTGTVAAADKN